MKLQPFVGCTWGLHSAAETGIPQHVPVMSSTLKKSGSPIEFSKVKTAVARVGESKESLDWQRDVAYSSLSKIKVGMNLS